MGRKKTNYLRDGGQLCFYIEQLQLILKAMRRFPVGGLAGGRMPDDVQKALTIFFISDRSPEFVAHEVIITPPCGLHVQN